MTLTVMHKFTGFDSKAYKITGEPYETDEKGDFGFELTKIEYGEPIDHTRWSGRWVDVTDLISCLSPSFFSTLEELAVSVLKTDIKERSL